MPPITEGLVELAFELALERRVDIWWVGTGWAGAQASREDGHNDNHTRGENAVPAGAGECKPTGVRDRGGKLRDRILLTVL